MTKKILNSVLLLLDKKDLQAVSLILLLIIPAYFLFLYGIPFQMHSDEVLDFSLIKLVPNQFNPFGVISYDGMPQLRLKMFEVLVSFIGPLTIFNLRIIGAIFAVLVVILGYLFFRLFSPVKTALIASLLLGLNHTFIIFARSMHPKIPPLIIEIIALMLLLKALNRMSYALGFLSGLMAGLSFYIYFSSRTVIVLVVSFFLVILIFFRKKYGSFKLLRLFLTTILGFILVITPMLLTNLKSSNTQDSYIKKQIFIFPEGRERALEITGDKTEIEALKSNISNGLLVFNKNIPDKIRNYYNPKFGMVDPLTGILLWVGLMILFMKKQRSEGETIIISSFLSLYFIFSFVINMAPNYARMIIILPFTSYLSAVGLISVMHWLKKVKNVVIFTVLLIIFINIAIFIEYALDGFIGGDSLGATTRYIDKRYKALGYKFYVASDENYPYHPWGGHDYGWLGSLLPSYQTLAQIQPEDINSFASVKPFTIFMPNNLWLIGKDYLINVYPELIIHNIKPDGSLVAIEVR